jgi:hypothetical protein
MLVTVPIFLDQLVGECTGDFGSVGWLLFPFFVSGYCLLVPFILDQAVGCCSHYFG